MLQVEVDLFSGRPNPAWVVPSDDAATVLLEVALQTSVVTPIDAGFRGLGYRGVILRLLGDDLATRYSLPAEFQIAAGASTNESKGFEIAERLVSGMLRGLRVSDDLSTAPLFTDEGQQGLLQLLTPFPRRAVSSSTVPAEPEQDLENRGCTVESTQFNPAFWNSDPNVQWNNNCYNYATNRRTNSFAQPGRASGAMVIAPYTCDRVCPAVVKDGAHVWTNCFPDSEKPRWFAALVCSDPGSTTPGFHDYHFYRHSAEGFWGHKPGHTAVTNLDNSNRLVVDPRTADRGPYVNFCTFLIAPKSMVIS